MIYDEFTIISSRALKGYAGASDLRIVAIEPSEAGPRVRWEAPSLAHERVRRPLDGDGTSLGPVAGPVLLGVLVRMLAARWRTGTPRCAFDWDVQLASRFPDVFGPPGPETGPGWSWLWEGGAEAILAAGVPRNFRTVQTKEKFGTIRWYYAADEDCPEVDEIVDAVESLSDCICEDCGRPGRIRRGSWLKCLCDVHAKGRPGG